MLSKITLDSIGFFGKPVDGCLVWRFALDEDGYAVIGRKRIRVARHLLQLKTGFSGEGWSALHTCDLPACVEPTHLYWGTTTDNNRDRWQRRARRATIDKGGRRYVTRQLRRLA